jgi:hypothetical protein
MRKEASPATWKKKDEIPDISLDLVLKNMGLIERMGRERLMRRA